MVSSIRTGRWPTTLWELIQRAQRGMEEERKAAVDKLVRLYYPPVLRFFRRVLRIPHHDAQDVAQDFFAQFVNPKFLARITYQKSFRSFVKLACRRQYWKVLRHGRPTPPLPSPMPAPATVDDEFRAWFIDEAVNRLQERLRPDQFEVFLARVRFDGERPETYESIALRLGMSVFDVRNDLAQSRKAFREELMRLASERTADPRQELDELGLLPYL